jgi:hypothetical protein
LTLRFMILLRSRGRLMVGADTSLMMPVEMIGLDVADLILDAGTGFRYWAQILDGGHGKLYPLVPGDRPGAVVFFIRTETDFMTRFELLQLLVGQARSNGFEFRKWYVSKLGLPWQNARQAVETLAAERRYYALLFSHEFASSFWKPGEVMTFQVPTQTFTRRMKDGTIGTVKRKGYTRRSAREDAWLYHLKELAASEEPLRYMRRYLRVEDELEDDALMENGS